MREAPPPTHIGLDVPHITVVHLSTMDKKHWHVACNPNNSSKACWAMHAVIKKKYTTNIVTIGKGTPVPAYIGIWNHYKFIKP